MIDQFIEFLVSLYGKDAYNYIPTMNYFLMFTNIYKTTPEETSELQRFVKECLQNAKLEQMENDFL